MNVTIAPALYPLLLAAVSNRRAGPEEDLTVLASLLGKVRDLGMVRQENGERYLTAEATVELTEAEAFILHSAIRRALRSVPAERAVAFAGICGLLEQAKEARAIAAREATLDERITAKREELHALSIEHRRLTQAVANLRAAKASLESTSNTGERA